MKIRNVSVSLLALGIIATSVVVGCSSSAEDASDMSEGAATAGGGKKNAFGKSMYDNGGKLEVQEATSSDGMQVPTLCENDETVMFSCELEAGQATGPVNISLCRENTVVSLRSGSTGGAARSATGHVDLALIGPPVAHEEEGVSFSSAYRDPDGAEYVVEFDSEAARAFLTLDCSRAPNSQFCKTMKADGRGRLFDCMQDTIVVGFDADNHD